MEKKQYTMPSAEQIAYAFEDIIVASGENPGDGVVLPDVPLNDNGVDNI